MLCERFWALQEFQQSRLQTRRKTLSIGGLWEVKKTMERGSAFFRISPPSLPLTPFTNQVGGHASVLRFSDKALCKPLDQREQNFNELVEELQPELSELMATYLGVVNVTFPSPGDTVDPGIDDIDGEYWMLEGTPVVIFEKNKHILFEGFGTFAG
ncbi:Inositol hexakisphosphate kinase 1 [Quaeritorhiza haematococci]|nr:Inositol hexakisphosphate kinase 1 [Quaeritorhiza haematococci]